jgi:hypothetical protein
MPLKAPKVIGRKRSRKGRPPHPGTLPSIKDFIIPEPEKTEEKEMLGNVEILHEKVRYALHLAACNFTHGEIAHQVGEHFQCEPPARNTVTEWLQKYHEAADADCVEYRNSKRQQQGRIIDALLKRWLPVAMADKFAMMRFRVVDGKEVQVLDENAYDEQSKAAAIVIKLLERDARLWNLDLAKEEGKGNSVSADKINLYINQQVAALSAPKGGAIDVDATPVEALELHAGNGDIDTL